MLLIFDLDDTLYEEMSFVKSGISAVAAFLEEKCHIPRKMTEKRLLQLLEVERKNLFDRYLLEKNLFTKSLVKKCVSIYRSHEPKIVLSKEAKECLLRFKNERIYVITDGNHLVQRKKVKALRLEKYVNQCFYTYSHGHHRSKPSPYCFEKISQKEKLKPCEIVYIADNPYKDFVGIKPLGFHTVRLLQGPFKQAFVSEEYEAEASITSLDEITDSFLKKLVKT